MRIINDVNKFLNVLPHLMENSEINVNTAKIVEKK